MTLQEVVIELRNSKKIYLNAGLKQAYFSQMLIKIENDLCKPKTKECFFNKFGYYSDFGLLWTKKKQ